MGGEQDLGDSPTAPHTSPGVLHMNTLNPVSHVVSGLMWTQGQDGPVPSSQASLALLSPVSCR